MAATVFSSLLYSKMFPTGDTCKLWTDAAEVRAMLLVEGALAKVQGAQGIIPELSAAFIHRSSLEVQIDAARLGNETGQNGVSVPGLVTAFRTAMEAPEFSQHVHWGATSQDIIDTGLMLRLRQTLAIQEERLKYLLQSLAIKSRTYAKTPMAARTYGQHATPTSWGAVLAQWGEPIADAMTALPTLKNTSLLVSLSGSSGTASVLGPDAPATRAALAEALKLADPKRSWHTDRGPILRISNWMCDLVAALATMGQGLIGLTGSDTGEVSLGNVGESSTMPQKQNPVGPSVLVALNNQMAGLRASLQSAAAHQHQRDGAAWFTEWMVLPQIALSAATALEIACSVVEDMQPDIKQMTKNLGGLGLVHAEALSFALAKEMQRSDAQKLVKKLVAQAHSTKTPLSEIVLKARPELPISLFQVDTQLGNAPAAANAFATRVETL